MKTTAIFCAVLYYVLCAFADSVRAASKEDALRQEQLIESIQI